MALFHTHPLASTYPAHLLILPEAPPSLLLNPARRMLLCHLAPATFPTPPPACEVPRSRLRHIRAPIPPTHPHPHACVSPGGEVPPGQLLDPVRGNVAFCAAASGWSFTLQSFARLYVDVYGAGFDPRWGAIALPFQGWGGPCTGRDATPGWRHGRGAGPGMKVVACQGPQQGRGGVGWWRVQECSC